MGIAFVPEIGAGRNLNELASAAYWFSSNIFINHISLGRDFIGAILQ
jgi:hypothetical protein